MGSRRIELIYDDGPMFQNCLKFIREQRSLGANVVGIKMNSDTAHEIIRQSELHFDPEDYNFLVIDGVTVFLSEELGDGDVRLVRTLS